MSDRAEVPSISCVSRVSHITCVQNMWWARCRSSKRRLSWALQSTYVPWDKEEHQGTDRGKWHEAQRRWAAGPWYLRDHNARGSKKGGKPPPWRRGRHNCVPRGEFGEL